MLGHEVYAISPLRVVTRVSVVSEQDPMMLISVLDSPHAALHVVQSDDMMAYARSNVRGAPANRSSQSADKSPTPAESHEAAAQDCQQDAAVSVPGEKREKEEEKGEGGKDDEAEETEDQQQLEEEDEDERHEHVDSSKSNAGEPKEGNVEESDLQVEVAPEAAPDSEMLEESPLTELGRNTPDVSV